MQLQTLYYLYLDSRERIVAVERHREAIERSPVRNPESRLFDGLPVNEDVMREMITLQGGCIVRRDSVVMIDGASDAQTRISAASETIH